MNNKGALASGIAKLAMAGQQAGFTVEQMIQLLNAGLGVQALLELIARRLEQPKAHGPISRSSNWVV